MDVWPPFRPIFRGNIFVGLVDEDIVASTTTAHLQ